jgi:hypothetical protein
MRDWLPWTQFAAALLGILAPVLTFLALIDRL